MAKLFGALVGIVYAGTTALRRATNSFHEKGTDHVLRRDKIELAAAPVNDTISLGLFGSNAYLDQTACVAYFDNLGAAVTMDVGAVGATAALVSAQAVGGAAGTFSLFKSVDIDNYFKPLWQVLGLAADPGGKIELLATIKGAAATGTFVWSIKGQDR